MKIAVLSDIHSNLPALQAVADDIDAWRPEAVFVAGDIVNRGPRPAECLSFVLERQKTHGWRVVRGNHEDYVIHHTRPDAPREGPDFEVFRPSYWCYEQLGFDASALEAMPFAASIEARGGAEVRATHASMGGISEGIYPFTSDEELKALISPAPAVLAVGHTHFPLVRRLNGTLVVNAGAAGLPFDGDTRPSYARIQGDDGEWRAEIVRLEYDRQQAERDFYETGYLENGGPLIELVLVELRTAYPQLGGWARKYQRRAQAGEISMQNSVKEHLRSQGLA